MFAAYNMGNNMKRTNFLIHKHLPRDVDILSSNR